MLTNEEGTHSVDMVSFKQRVVSNEHPEDSNKVLIDFGKELIEFVQSGGKFQSSKILVRMFYTHQNLTFNDKLYQLVFQTLTAYYMKL